MGKITSYRFLCGLIGVGFMSVGSHILAADRQMQDLLEASKQRFVTNNLPSAQDLLRDNEMPPPPAPAIAPHPDEQSMEGNSEEKDAENNPLDDDDNDAANDYDSNKESASEEAAPTPQEEEDTSQLDEEGNVSNPANRDQKKQKGDE